MTAPTGSAADGLDASSTQLSRDGAEGTQQWREAPLPALQPNIAASPPASPGRVLTSPTA